MSIKNILIIVILALIVSLPFVTKANDNQGPTSVRRLADISYVEGSKNPAQALDLYLPTKTKSPTPLIVFVHGGAWLQGSKEEAQHDLGAFFGRQGFAFASINYRLSQEAVFPAQIEDCKAAIRFLRAHAAEYNINPDKIGVWGVSAGGHLVALLGTSGGAKELEGNLGNNGVDSKVQAVADWCGPSDFVSVASQAGSRTKIDFESKDGPVAKLLGGLQTEKHDLAVAASPVTYIDKDDPPFLIVHGDIDDLVPYAQSQELEEKLNQAGVPNKLITISGGGHAFTSEEQLNHVVDFFKETLIKGNRKFTLSDS
ncbi:MAG: alpha/beta hydrolase [Cyanobacteria bacterium SZAS LIN-2]|nr:alpha/beta hydrolase [Cyanobacteria bacterium SZAS LIN-3]MBS1995102.1 alpha/beta hydrolase [Cyanobacteria bacterium SZAS LIN-2]